MPGLLGLLRAFAAVTLVAPPPAHTSGLREALKKAVMSKCPYGGGLLWPDGMLWPAAGPWRHFWGTGAAGAKKEPIPLLGSR